MATGRPGAGCPPAFTRASPAAAELLKDLMDNAAVGRAGSGTDDQHNLSRHRLRGQPAIGTTRPHAHCYLAHNGQSWTYRPAPHLAAAANRSAASCAFSLGGSPSLTVT